MVHKTPEQAFAARLHAAIDKCAGAPKGKRGRAQWLKGYAGRALKVTDRAINKWLDGKAFPETANIEILAEVLGISKSWLHYGTGDMFENAGVSERNELFYDPAAGTSQPLIHTKLVAPLQSTARNSHLARIIDGFDELPEDRQLNVLSVFVRELERTRNERSNHMGGGRGKSSIVDE